LTAEHQLVIRPLRPSEVHEMAQVHVGSFRGFYLTQLGPRFLAAYYRLMTTDPGGICIGAFRGSKLVGFVAGFQDPHGFYARVRRAAVELGLAALPALMRRPPLAFRFVNNYRLTRRVLAMPQPGRACAELASLAVCGDEQGRGIGGRLVRAFVEEAQGSGVLVVKLTTDTNGNDAVNRFYVRTGFTVSRSFEAQPGRYLNEYWLAANESCNGTQCAR
jgi:GNAT superfamily N-acetyltransferase